jgi:predicted MPP superfamily phosphohydrolase
VNRKKRLLAAAAAVAIPAFCWWQNNGLMVTHYPYFSSKIPKGFDGYRIVQLSDLHNKLFGRNQSPLLNRIALLHPDVIVITGDLIHRTPMTNAILLVRRAMEIAPVYYVPGNHEGRYPHTYAKLTNILKRIGVVLLENQSVVLTSKTDRITLSGVQDPRFIHTDNSSRWELFDYILSALADECETEFQVLLSHRPEKLECYAYYGFDLVLTGHAHGGQFRIPGIGGVLSPSQGFFPPYAEGKLRRGETTEIISRGLGNSDFPLRLGNRPEIVLVTLHAR